MEKLNMIVLASTGLAVPLAAFQDPRSKITAFFEIHEESHVSFSQNDHGLYELAPEKVIVSQQIVARPVLTFDLPGEGGEMEQFDEVIDGAIQIMSKNSTLEDLLATSGPKRRSSTARILQKAEELQDSIAIATRSPLTVSVALDEIIEDDEDSSEDMSETDYEDEDEVGPTTPEMVSAMRDQVEVLLEKIRRSYSKGSKVLTLNSFETAESEEDEEDESEEDTLVSAQDATAILEAAGADKASIAVFRKSVGTVLKNFINSALA